MIISKKIYTVKGVVGREKFAASSINEVVDMYKTLHDTTMDPETVELFGNIYIESNKLDTNELDLNMED